MTASKPLQPGDQAPDFVLHSVRDESTVSLSDYRGRSPLLLGLFPGLYCPFCRRALVLMSASSEKLKPLGIESLAVVATDLENARLYFKFRPTSLPLAADPEQTTHRSFGVPRVDLTPELMQAIEGVRFNPTGELPEALGFEEAAAALEKLDGYTKTAVDRRDEERHAQSPQLKGQFLIDRDGVIQWANIEAAREGPAGIGKFPTLEELLVAVEVTALR